MSAVIEAVNKMLAPIRNRIENMVARGVVRLINDSAKMQELQVSILQGESRDYVERFQNYGFTSHPPKGSEALLVFPGGNRAHPVAIAVDDRASRKKEMAEGEAALYTKFGDYIHIKADGTIEVVASSAVTVEAPEVTVTASTKVTLDTPACEITGALTVGETIEAGGDITSTGGDISADGNVTAGEDVSASGDVLASGDVSDGSGSIAGVRSTFNSHTHISTIPGSPTAPPIPTM